MSYGLAFTGITLWVYLAVGLGFILLGFAMKFGLWLFKDRDTKDRETVSINDLMGDDK